LKLILYSIVCGFLFTVLASLILHISGNQVGSTGIIGMGIIGFFSPSFYVLNKLYENSKK
jgi:hypothetical protein